MRRLLIVLLACLVAGAAAAQTTTTRTDQLIASTKAIIGATALGSHTLDVTGTFGVSGAATLSSTLGVTGLASLNGGIAVDTDRFTVADATGNTLIAGTAGITGNTTIGDSAYVSRSTYASQTTGWRIGSDGGADFRYLFVDELHAKSFIADLEMALAGGQIISKSVAMVSTGGFSCPSAGGAAPLLVRDLPSMPNTAAFQANDWVALRTFVRSAGSLTIAECVGQVTNYADGSGVPGGGGTPGDGEQSWTFTRGTSSCAGGMADSTTIAPDALALDFGSTGNGYYEVNAIDGAYAVNAPYAQVVTWTTCPIAANRTLRARWGQLNGAYGYSSSTWGFAAGDPAAANLTVDPTNGVRIRYGTTNLLTATSVGIGMTPNVGAEGDATKMYAFTSTLDSQRSGLWAYESESAGARSRMVQLFNRVEGGSASASSTASMRVEADQNDNASYPYAYVQIGASEYSGGSPDPSSTINLTAGAGGVLRSLFITSTGLTFETGTPTTQFSIDSDGDAEFVGTLKVSAPSGGSVQAAEFTSASTVSTYISAKSSGTGTPWVIMGAIPGATPSGRVGTITNHKLDFTVNDTPRLTIGTDGGITVATLGARAAGNTSSVPIQIGSDGLVTYVNNSVSGTCSAVTVTNGIVTGCTP